MTNYHPHAHALAGAMKRRRQSKGWSYRRIVENEGPSKPTILKYERGQIPEVVDDVMMHRIDVGYEWKDGSTRALLEGNPDDPEAATPAPADVWADLSQSMEEMVDNTTLDLMASVRSLEKVLTKYKMPDDVREAVGEIKHLARQAFREGERLKEKYRDDTSDVEAPKTTRRVKGASLYSVD